MVHNITLNRWDETFHFASVDGEDWLPLNRPLRDGEEAEFFSLLNGDGNFMHMRFARRWFSFQDPRESEMTLACSCAGCAYLREQWETKKGLAA